MHNSFLVKIVDSWQDIPKKLSDFSFFHIAMSSDEGVNSHIELLSDHVNSVIRFIDSS